MVTTWSKDTDPESLLFNDVEGLAYDKINRLLYVIDGSALYKIDSNGICYLILSILTVMSGVYTSVVGRKHYDKNIDGDLQSAALDHPACIAVDNTGCVYVGNIYGKLRQITSSKNGKEKFALILCLGEVRTVPKWNERKLTNIYGLACYGDSLFATVQTTDNEAMILSIQ